MIVSLAAALAAFSAAPSEPSAWVVLARHDRGLLAVDRASVVREAETVRYRTLVAPRGGGENLGVAYAYQIYQWTVDCHAMTFEVGDGTEYGPEGQALELPDKGIPPLPQPAQALPPGSPILKVADAVCKDRWGDKPPMSTPLEVYRLSLS